MTSGCFPRKSFLCIFGLFLFVVVSFYGQEETWLYSRNSVSQGEALEVFALGNDLSDLQFSLQAQSRKALSRNGGWLFGESLYATLLGIPAGLAPGPYKLVMEANTDRGSLRLEKDVLVKKVKYAERQILLNRGMSDTLDKPSEIKKTQAIQLWSVLSAFNKDSIFHEGKLLQPVKAGQVTGQYGDRRRYARPNGRMSRSIHLGDDYAAKRGAEVSAAGSGRVVLAMNRVITGNTIIIEHLPGVYSLYYHLDEIHLNRNEIVSQGQLIGTVGSTGFSTGEHLHWELRVGSVAVNPSSRLSVPLLDTSLLYGRM